jgi:cytochrome P450
MELGGYIDEQLGRAAADPQDDLLGDLVAACAAGVIEPSTALFMLITLFSAGGESTASLIGSAAWILASRQDIQQQVRDDPLFLARFLKRCCASSHRFVATTVMWFETPLLADSS